jgi:hypothetical protein
MGWCVMINRILITGKNSQIPHLRDLRICPDCDGDGWVHCWGNNPSEPPFRAECRCCNGQGAIERRPAPPASQRYSYDLTAERWLDEPHTGMKPVSRVSGDLRHTHNAAHTRPAVVPSTLAAGRSLTAVDVFTTVLGMLCFGAIGYVLLVLA